MSVLAVSDQTVPNLSGTEQSTAEFLMIQPMFKARFSGELLYRLFLRVGGGRAPSSNLGNR